MSGEVLRHILPVSFLVYTKDMAFSAQDLDLVFCNWIAPQYELGLALNEVSGRFYSFFLYFYETNVELGLIEDAHQILRFDDFRFLEGLVHEAFRCVFALG